MKCKNSNWEKLVKNSVIEFDLRIAIHRESNLVTDFFLSFFVFEFLHLSQTLSTPGLTQAEPEKLFSSQIQVKLVIPETLV